MAGVKIILMAPFESSSSSVWRFDPKPFVGDPSYHLVQHLYNCEARFHADPIGMVKQQADLAEVDADCPRCSSRSLGWE